MVKVSIITVNYNQPSITEALLESIRSVNTYNSFEVIVVDNGSSHDPVPIWQKQYADIHFIRSDQNLGFAGGNNLGIAQARGQYLFFVNNDTELTPDLIHGLVDYLDLHIQVGMVSPKIHYYDEPGIIQYAGYTPMKYLTARNACIGQFERDNGQYDGVIGPTGYIHGAAMMVRREAIEKAGKMPENYFLYYEEFDWVEAIKNAGFEIHVHNDLLIYHKESVSVGRNSALKTYFMNRNRILFVRRNASSLTFFFFCIYFLVIVTPRNIMQYIRSGHAEFIPVLLQAIGWHFKNTSDSTYLGFTQRS